jgi:hypothetical protein
MSSKNISRFESLKETVDNDDNNMFKKNENLPKTGRFAFVNTEDGNDDYGNDYGNDGGNDYGNDGGNDYGRDRGRNDYGRDGGRDYGRDGGRDGGGRDYRGGGRNYGGGGGRDYGDGGRGDGGRDYGRDGRDYGGGRGGGRDYGEVNSFREPKKPKETNWKGRGDINSFSRKFTGSCKKEEEKKQKPYEYKKDEFPSL